MLFSNNIIYSFIKSSRSKRNGEIKESPYVNDQCETFINIMMKKCNIKLEETSEICNTYDSNIW